MLLDVGTIPAHGGEAAVARCVDAVAAFHKVRILLTGCRCDEIRGSAIAAHPDEVGAAALVLLSETGCTPTNRHDTLTIGREDWLLIQRLCGGETRGSSTRCARLPDVAGIRFGPGRESNPLTIRRPRRMELHARCICESLWCTTGKIDQIQFVECCEGQPFAVGRGHRVADLAYREAGTITHRILELHFRTEVLFDIDGEGNLLRRCAHLERDAPDLALIRGDQTLRVGREGHARIDVARGA